jgi:hypothetical protein
MERRAQLDRTGHRDRRGRGRGQAGPQAHPPPMRGRLAAPGRVAAQARRQPPRGRLEHQVRAEPEGDPGEARTFL